MTETTAPAVVTGASSGIGLESTGLQINSSIASTMPGPTHTACFERADMLDTKVGTQHKGAAAYRSIAEPDSDG